MASRPADQQKMPDRWATNNVPVSASVPGGRLPMSGLCRVDNGFWRALHGRNITITEISVGTSHGSLRHFSASPTGTSHRSVPHNS
jgi:hypothetical protein